MLYTDIYDLRVQARLTRAEACAWLGISLRTLDRYETAHQAPRAVALALSLAGGQIGALPKAGGRWVDWYMDRSGNLRSPEGDEFREGDLRALYLYKATAQNLRAELRTAQTTAEQLRADVARLTAPPPLPDNVIRFPQRKDNAR